MQTLIQCDHQCSGNCRRVGCNCKCGEWHIENRTLKVCHDMFPENEVIINGVECDFCGGKEHPDMVHNYEWGQTICEGCFDHYTSRWE